MAEKIKKNKIAIKKPSQKKTKNSLKFKMKNKSV